MATEKQLAANRRNAELSTGPRSVEGKAVSRRNALKTGLYCNGIIIGKESTAQLEALEAAYTAEYAPATPTERALVDSLIHYEWLLRRYRWLETEVWRSTLDRMTDYQRQESWAGNAFMDQPAISRIHRLRNSTQRMFHETLAQLRKPPKPNANPLKTQPLTPKLASFRQIPKKKPPPTREAAIPQPRAPTPSPHLHWLRSVKLPDDHSPAPDPQPRPPSLIPPRLSDKMVLI